MSVFVAWIFGILGGVWFGWYVWRRPVLRYSIEKKAQDISIDRELGIEELPTIRVSIEVADALNFRANQEGVIVQAYVRAVLERHVKPSTDESENDSQPSP